VKCSDIPKTECHVIDCFWIELDTTNIDRLVVFDKYSVTALLITNLGLIFK
jgi:hypothetical protein